MATKAKKVKKAPAKKAAPKKVAKKAARKVAPKKSAKKVAPKKKVAVKKVAAKKQVKKVVKKPVVKKAAVKKPAVKKSVAKKSAAKKFLLPVFIGFFSLWLLYKFLIADRFQQSQIQEVIPQEHNASIPEPSKKQQPKEVNLDKKDDKNPFFAVRCFRKSCNFKGIDYSFDENTMYKFINAFNCKVIIPDNTDPLFTLYVLRCDKDLQKVIDLYSKNSTSSRTVQNEETSLNPVVSK